jgi:hypothetical protein
MTPAVSPGSLTALDLPVLTDLNLSGNHLAGAILAAVSNCNS